jgi:hypothetical protein
MGNLSGETGWVQLEPIMLLRLSITEMREYPIQPRNTASILVRCTVRTRLRIQGHNTVGMQVSSKPLRALLILVASKPLRALRIQVHSKAQRASHLKVQFGRMVAKIRPDRLAHLIREAPMAIKAVHLIKAASNI